MVWPTLTALLKGIPGGPAITVRGGRGASPEAAGAEDDPNAGSSTHGISDSLCAARSTWAKKMHG